MENQKIINEWKTIKEDCTKNQIYDLEEIKAIFEFKLKIEGILK